MNRDYIEIFIDWFGRSLEIEDCDTALFMTNYFFDRFEYNSEQRLWLSWLYGTTYYWPTSYVIWNEFPDMELVGVDRLRDWNNENYKRLRYQTDTKWNKGHLPGQFVSYKEWVGDRTQREAITAKFVGDPVKDFYILWDEVNSWHKFGRYTSWFYIQTLKQCCNIPVDVDNLWFHDYSGSRSHRNGMCYVVGRPDLIDQKLSDMELRFFNSTAKEILLGVKLRYPHVADKADYFGMETCLCSFKKLFRTREGRYLGYYIDRQLEEIRKVENDNWFGIDWNPMHQAREEKLDRNYLTNGIDKSKMVLFLETNNFDPVGRSMGLEAFM